ncbi:MAG: hypothetical protein IJP90_15025 [Treponema sp.]|nr:hypothetical protein [Treponema sp.]MBR0101008.1 hypothetical protein [Treponema sp.]
MTRLEQLYEEMSNRKLISSKKEFAEKFGFDAGNLARYLNGHLKTTLDGDNYRKFLDAGINVEWLLTGEGEMFLPVFYPERVKMLSEKIDADIQKKNDEIAKKERIPILSQKVSCGPGQSWEHEDNIVEYLDVRSLSPVLNSKNVYGFRAIGTSMLGAGIRDGDIVLFNADKDCPPTDGIYVFGLDGDTYCKRLEFDRLANRIKIYSVRVADLEKAELLKTLDSTDEEFAERFKMFGKVFSWIHVANDEGM